MKTDMTRRCASIGTKLAIQCMPSRVAAITGQIIKPKGNMRCISEASEKVVG